MAYDSFTFKQLIEDFDLSLKELPDLFAAVPCAKSSELLKTTLAEGIDLAVTLDTNKARSELIIASVMLELWRRFDKKISLFLGIDFAVCQNEV